MITGPIKSQIDQIWNAFWSGGISTPIEVIEQITYLLFLRRLDDLHTLGENKAARIKGHVARRVFPEGKDGIGKKGGRPYDDLRWSRFKHFAPAEMYTVVSEHVFPFLRTLGGDDSTYAHHMKDARFTIPTPGLLAKVVDLLDHVPRGPRHHLPWGSAPHPGSVACGDPVEDVIASPRLDPPWRLRGGFDTLVRKVCSVSVISGALRLEPNHFFAIRC